MASDSPHERIASSAGHAGAATLTSRILGLMRDQVLAAFFGAGHEMDAFVVAFRIPNLVRDLFAEGEMNSAFVPTFTTQLTLHGKAAAWRLGNNVINVIVLVTGALVLLGCLFARPLVTAYAQDFGRVPAKLELTIQLTRVVLPFLTMAAVAAAVAGMLNSLQHYFVPALAPATVNVATIVGVVAAAPLMPALGLPPIMVLAIAAVLGGAGQIALQWPLLRREGYRYRPFLDLRDPGLRQVMLLMGPATLGLAVTQVNLFVGTLLATRQGSGAVSWLQYAFRLVYLPVGLFSGSIATALLPTVARHAAVADTRAVGRTVTHGIGLMLLVTVPATAGLLVLSREIVALLFERGRFLPSDTMATALALRCYAVGLIGYSALRIVTPVFYALGRSRTPVLLGALSISLNLVLSVALVPAMGFSGLALATALSAIFNGIASLWLLDRQLDGLDGRPLATQLGKIVAASVVMAVVVRWTLGGMLTLMPGSGAVATAVRLAAAIAAGMVGGTLAATLLQIAEVDHILREGRRRLRRRPRADRLQ